MLMKNLLVLLSLILTFTQAQDDPQENYTLYTSFDSAQKSVVWMQTTADNRYLSIIGFSQSGEKQQKVYDTFTWSPISSQLIFGSEKLNLRTFFLSPSNQSCLLLFGNDNRLVLRVFSESYQSYTEEEIYKFGDQKIISVVVSSDGSMWGTNHQINGLYYGKINQPGVATILKPTEGTQLFQTFIFRPNKNQLILSAPSSIYQEKSFLFKYDLQTNQLTKLFNNARYPSFTFLPSGRLLTKYIFNSNCTISQMDVDTGQIINENFGINQCRLEMMGSIVKISFNENTYKYYFDNQKEFRSDNYFFSTKTNNDHAFVSKLKSGALTYFVKEGNNSTKITVYKMCNVDGFFYNQFNCHCQACHQSCRTCITRADTCLSCKDESYQFDMRAYNCMKKQIMDNNDWILIVLGSLMCVVIIVVATIFMKRRHNKKKQNLRSSMLSQNMQTLQDYQVVN